MSKIILDQAVIQLKEACKATGARWITWLEHNESGWYFSASSGFNHARKEALSQFINNPKISTWLAGALGSGRVRSHAVSSKAAGLGCQRVYAFPNQAIHNLLVVGADGLDSFAEKLLHILSLQPLLETPPEAQRVVTPEDVSRLPLEPGWEPSYDPQHTLESILEYLAGHVNCNHAILAIRSGESFQIQAVWENPTDQHDAGLQGIDLPIQDDELLAKVVSTRRGLLVNDLSQASIRLKKAISPNASCWLLIPILIGQRVIGMTAFASHQPGVYGQAELQHMTWQTNRLASNLENAITFKEVARYLQQLALLNELASMASLGVEPVGSSLQDEFARRVMVRLRRVFKTDWAAVLLLSPDGQLLHEYGAGSRVNPPWSVPVSQSIMGTAVSLGQPVRVGDLTSVSHKYLLDP